MRASLTQALVALGALLVAINVGSAMWDIRDERRRTEERAQRDFRNLTHLLAEQTSASLDAADIVLRDAQRSGSAERVAAMAARLRDELVHITQVDVFFVLDERGEVLARTTELPSIDPDPASHPLFTQHRDGRVDGLFVSKPFLGGPVGTNWRFALSRRLSRPDGGFDGVVGAVVEVETFDRFYRMIELAEGGFITLLAPGGLVITRVPDPAHVRGQSFPDHEILAAVRDKGAYEGWTTSPILQERVLLSAETVRGFPLAVAVGGNETAVLAPWREAAWHVRVRTLLTSIAMLVLIALAAWGLARRERALERSEKRFRAMIEHSSDAVILTSPQSGGIFYASPAFERVTGYSGKELAGKDLAALLHPDCRERALKLRLTQLKTPGSVVVSEMQFRHKDGSWRWVENTISNLLHEPGVRAVVMNLRDITERKLADAERARLEQRLRQSAKMEAVGRLAGGIAHDFNNILGGILGYAEMLVESTAEGTRERRYAQNVLTGANRASDLVEQILSYSRSQRGKRVPVRLDPIVGETLELVRGSLPPGIRLEARVPAEPLYVVGDPTQLHQILMNLCTNAIHAMGEGGTLRVSVEATQFAEQRVFAHTTLQPGSYVRLRVEDTGSGMDESTLARLFEPFFTTKEVGKGTGLGLSLVYGIVTDSGGAIDVTSTVGEGSCFAIFLPSVESPAAVDEPSEAPVSRGRGERILVVDDEEALLAVTSELLKRLGYAPTAVADGDAALAAYEAAAGGFDAVITDEVMPGLSGTEVATRLRARSAELPILLVSGYIGPMMTERALAAGVTGILKKPVQSREIAAALARVLGGRDISAVTGA